MPRCEECAYCRCIRGQVRGVMDCDPDEWVCELDLDCFYDDDEDTECDEFYSSYDCRDDEDYYREREWEEREGK